MNIKINTPDMKDYQPKVGSNVCHYFLRAGVIEYLGDCTHALRGQKVMLPDWPTELGHPRTRHMYPPDDNG